MQAPLFDQHHSVSSVVHLQYLPPAYKVLGFDVPKSGIEKSLSVSKVQLDLVTYGIIELLGFKMAKTVFLHCFVEFLIS